MTSQVKLTPAEWREELRGRHARAVDAAISCEREYGAFDSRSLKAWACADAFGTLVRLEGA